MKRGERAALEAVAKEIKKLTPPDDCRDLYDVGYKQAISDIATAIRALSNKGGRDGE